MAIIVSASLALLGVLVAPRLGWSALALAACGALALAGHAGAAVLALCALAPTPVLLADAPWLWSVAPIAPALGLLGLAPIFPALAARTGAASRWRRAALALLGYWWLCVVEVLCGRRLLLGAPASARPRGTWLDSPGAAFEHVLVPLLRPDRLAPGLLWAVAALVLPWLMANARGWWRVALAICWSTALIGAGAYLAARAGGAFAASVLGAGALATLIALSVRPRRASRHGHHGVT
jgi:hypothetical protein